MLRLDADVTARQGALEAVLDRFAGSERAVLVGTQLVAKGHDFPDVRLAAAIDADVGLALADFRAEERTFSLLVQLAGRAGREGTGGRVLLQSWTPESRVVRLAARHAVDEFMDGEVARRATFGYPPHARLVRVLVAAPDVGAPERVLAGLAAHARAALPGRRGARARRPCSACAGRSARTCSCGPPRPAARPACCATSCATRPRALRRANGTAVVDVDPQSSDVGAHSAPKFRIVSRTLLHGVCDVFTIPLGPRFACRNEVDGSWTPPGASAAPVGAPGSGRRADCRWGRRHRVSPGTGYLPRMASTESGQERAARRATARAQIRQYPDPVLRQAARPVEHFDEDLKALAERMIRLMHDASGAGLAAPQIGLLRRLFVFQPDVDSEPRALVNPEIVERSEETSVEGEGCLSLYRSSTRT